MIIGLLAPILIGIIWFLIANAFSSAGFARLMPIFALLAPIWLTTALIYQLISIWRAPYAMKLDEQGVTCAFLGAIPWGKLTVVAHMSESMPNNQLVRERQEHFVILQLRAGVYDSFNLSWLAKKFSGLRVYDRTLVAVDCRRLREKPETIVFTAKLLADQYGHAIDTEGKLESAKLAHYLNDEFTKNPMQTNAVIQLVNLIDLCNS